MGIVDLDRVSFGAQAVDEIDDLAVAQIRHVFLECKPKHKDAAAAFATAFAAYGPRDRVCHIAAHAVIDPPASEDHLRVMAEALGEMGKIERIDPDAMPADEARCEGQEVPLRGGSRKHVVDREPEL